jgi:hypothetical protein
VNPLLSAGETLGRLDPACFSLRENHLVGDGNIANVNTGCNIDLDGDGSIDPDRNLDGYVDLETYPIMNNDLNGDFRRDDANSYPCPCDPLSDPDCPKSDPRRLFTRNAGVLHRADEARRVRERAILPRPRGVLVARSRSPR